MSKVLKLVKRGCANVNTLRNFNTQIIRKANIWSPVPQMVDQLESGYARLIKSSSKSLLKKHLTPTIFDRLKSRRTSFNSTLLDCVQSGFANLDSIIGVYAPDAEAYTVFAELFDPIIADLHRFDNRWIHPPKNFGNIHHFTNVDPFNMYVYSTKIEARRSLRDFAFTPVMSIHQYYQIQDIISKVVCGLEREFRGKFYDLAAGENEYMRYLKSCGYLFDDTDRFLRASNTLKGWPVGRGVFLSDDKKFIVWVNEEDHLRLFSKEDSGDIQGVYQRLIKATNMINMRVKFARHKRLGFLTTCPSNIGTTIRASVHIKLPKLSKDKAKFEEVAAKFNLQIRGTTGEHTESIGGVYDISNKQRIGLTEYQAVKTMQDGILEMIKIEQSLTSAQLNSK